MNSTKILNYLEVRKIHGNTHKKVRTSMKLAKEEWLKSLCRKIDNDLKSGVHSKIAYNTIKSITHTKSKTTTIIEYKYGALVAYDLSRQGRWTE